MPRFARLPPLSRLLSLTALALVLLLSSTGCDKGAGRAGSVDAEWHRRVMVDGLLARWLEAAPTPSGFMRTAFDRNWKADAAQPGYLTEQARLVYALIIGYEVTRDQRYLAAAHRGADFLLLRFRDPVHGGFFNRVAPDGAVVSGAKNTYGHAFALLALSHMFRVTADDRYRDAALKAWTDIDTWLRDPQGGFRGELPRNFLPGAKAGESGGSQNPIMHMFEALLALHDATKDPVALAGVKRIADFVVNRLMVGLPDGGAHIPEWYGANWKPLADREKGGYTDIGHQFEWSHMLMEAERRGLMGAYSQIAERILKFAIATGYDENEGGAYTRMYPDGTLVRDKYWWQQCEAIRAFLAAASLANQPEMWRRYEQTVALVRNQFIDGKYGGWHQKACNHVDCSGKQADPYHMVGMHQAALGMAAPAR